MMTDYTDLVKSLRRCSKAARCRGCKYYAQRDEKDCHEILLTEAADVIEKLCAGEDDGFIVETSLYNEEETHENCTVVIWRNSVTGKESVWWWENERKE